MKINSFYIRLMTLFFAFNFANTNAQNLVYNPGFEQFSSCPDYVSQINYCVGWERPTEGTSDYFNSCLNIPFSVSVPDNQFGYQQTYGGNGYAGLYTFYSTLPFTTVPDEDHEYITTQLLQPLQPGEVYYAEFKVSLAEAARYAVNEIGLLYSMTKPVRNDELAIEYSPQVVYNGQMPLQDKTGWTTISGCFTADSAYEFITIGNFNDGVHTVATDVGTQTSGLYYSYYYIDDVIVKKLKKPTIEILSLTCGNSVLGISNFSSTWQHQWSTGQTTTEISVNADDFYWCSVNTGECVVFSDSMYVDIMEPVSVSLGNDTLINFCLTNILTIQPVTDTSDALIYHWSTGSDADVITVNGSGLYLLTVTNTAGCIAMDSLLVSDECQTSPYIPNAFTPNGDGRNDYFSIIGIEEQIFNLSVFNRWGELVFTTDNIKEPWNGENAQSGMYIWKLIYSLNSINKEPGFIKTGHLFLIR